MLEILKVKIGSGNEVKLVSCVLGKDVDDEFTFLGLIKGEGHFEFLVLGVSNHVWYLINDNGK